MSQKTRAEPGLSLSGALKKPTRGEGAAGRRVFLGPIPTESGGTLGESSAQEGPLLTQETGQAPSRLPRTRQPGQQSRRQPTRQRGCWASREAGDEGPLGREGRKGAGEEPGNRPRGWGLQGREPAPTVRPLSRPPGRARRGGERAGPRRRQQRDEDASRRSATSPYLTLCHPVACSTPGSSDFHRLPEPAQSPVH